MKKNEYNCVLDTDNRWDDYCRAKGIANPFKENLMEYEDSPVLLQEWAYRRDAYLRLSHTFRLWDYHFWMAQAQFEQHLHWSKEFTDTDFYMPCDTVERQCSMACPYFCGDCPREREELKIPQILGFDGRWEFEEDRIRD